MEDKMAALRIMGQTAPLANCPKISMLLVLLCWIHFLLGSELFYAN